VQPHKKESFNIVRDTLRSGSLCLSLRMGSFRSCLSVQTTRRQEPFQELPVQRVSTPLFSSWLLDCSGGHRCVSPFITGTYSSPDRLNPISPPLLQVTQHMHGLRSTTLTSTARRVTLPKLESIRYHPINSPIDHTVCHSWAKVEPAAKPSQTEFVRHQ